ncbi:MAG: aa3-type cytochrome c oxidase subunit IV [Pseudomonadota bacterium]
MADQNPVTDIQVGAEMDYPEHEKTYNIFLALSKWGVIFNVVLLILMAIFLL